MAKAKTLKIQKQAGAARPYVIKEGKYRRNFKTMGEARAYVASQTPKPKPMARPKNAPTPTTVYLRPILEAATLLKLKPYPANVEQLTAVLDKLSPHFPGDTLKPVHALAILDGGMTGSVEELEILEKVWPSFSGDKRFTLTPTTLTWRWSSKHTGRHATITMPFPTILPMQVTVERFCDMDDLDNHGEECQVMASDEEESDWSSGCCCESFVEQTVSATVNVWDDQTEEALAVWLERAVDGEVKPVILGVKE